jgi:hypothetical protein
MKLMTNIEIRCKDHDIPEVGKCSFCSYLFNLEERLNSLHQQRKKLLDDLTRQLTEKKFIIVEIH